MSTAFGTTEYTIDSPYHGVVFAFSGAVGNRSIVLTFDKTVTSGAGAVAAGAGVARAPTSNGSEMIVPLSGVAAALKERARAARPARGRAGIEC